MDGEGREPFQDRGAGVRVSRGNMGCVEGDMRGQGVDQLVTRHG